MQTILLDAVRQRLGADSVLTGHHMTAWDETAAGIRAHFIDRRTGEQAGDAKGSLLIAADGIHSAVCARLYPHEGPPIWNGAILWRGVPPENPS